MRYCLHTSSKLLGHILFQNLLQYSGHKNIWIHDIHAGWISENIFIVKQWQVIRNKISWFFPIIFIIDRCNFVHNIHTYQFVKYIHKRRTTRNMWLIKNVLYLENLLPALSNTSLTFVIFDISEFKYIDTSFSRRAPGDAIRSMMFSLTLFFPSISRL